MYAVFVFLSAWQKERNSWFLLILFVCWHWFCIQGLLKRRKSFWENSKTSICQKVICLMRYALSKDQKKDGPLVHECQCSCQAHSRNSVLSLSRQNTEWQKHSPHLHCHRGDVSECRLTNLNLKAGKGLLKSQVPSKVKIYPPLHWATGR